MFKFDTLQEIKSFAGRIRYCDENLSRMKAGSARRTYDMGDGKVLKLALNAKGLAQNNVESDAGLGIMYPDELNEPIDWDGENNTWLTSAKLENATKKDIEDFYGVSWPDLCNYFIDMGRYVLSNNRNKTPDVPQSDNEVKNERMNVVNRLLADSDILASDFTQISAFGKDDNGLIKFIDFGFNKEVFVEHYQIKDNNSYGY
jgi:hypothetical protein